MTYEFQQNFDNGVQPVLSPGERVAVREIVTNAVTDTLFGNIDRVQSYADPNSEASMWLDSATPEGIPVYLRLGLRDSGGANRPRVRIEPVADSEDGTGFYNYETDPANGDIVRLDPTDPDELERKLADYGVLEDLSITISGESSGPMEIELGTLQRLFDRMITDDVEQGLAEIEELNDEPLAVPGFKRPPIGITEAQVLADMIYGGTPSSRTDNN